MAAPLDHHWSMQTRPVVSLIAPSAAYRIDDWMGAARRLGVGVAVVTEAHHGLAEDMGAELIPIDFDDPADAAVRIAASPLPIEAIIPVDDRGVEIAARAAALRGLVHNPVGTAAATRDKAELRRRLQGIVPQPRFMALEAGRPGREALAVGVPAVVKPVGLSGSTGVIRVDDPGRLDAVIERVRSIATAHGRPPDSPVLAEQYVPGAEVAVEGMVTDGRWDTLAVFDKPDPLVGPYFTETHYTTPSRHPPEVVAEIEAVASRAARALGIVRGSVHAELRIGRRAVLLEVASPRHRGTVRPLAAVRPVGNPARRAADPQRSRHPGPRRPPSAGRLGRIDDPGPHPGRLHRHRRRRSGAPDRARGRHKREPDGRPGGSTPPGRIDLPRLRLRPSTNPGTGRNRPAPSLGQPSGQDRTQPLCDVTRRERRPEARRIEHMTTLIAGRIDLPGFRGSRSVSCSGREWRT